MCLLLSVSVEREHSEIQLSSKAANHEAWPRDTDSLEDVRPWLTFFCFCTFPVFSVSASCFLLGFSGFTWESFSFLIQFFGDLLGFLSLSRWFLIYSDLWPCEFSFQFPIRFMEFIWNFSALEQGFIGVMSMRLKALTLPSEKMDSLILCLMFDENLWNRWQC